MKRLSQQRPRCRYPNTKVKYYPTKTLKAFIDNDFTGVDGLDREQYADEIKAVYWQRMNEVHEAYLAHWEEQFQDYQTFLDETPPEFHFTYDHETDTYIPF